jgi:MFS family permease
VRERRQLVAALLGVFVSLFPILMVVAALPDIATDLHTSTSTLAWVLTAPLIASSVVLPSAGRLGDLYGHRRVFLTGLALSGTFAVLAALAWNPLSLIVFRTISQASGTAVSPSAIALVISSREPSERTRVLGFWAFSTAIAPAMGLLIGGPAVDVLSWRGLFAIQAGVVLLVVPYAAAVLDETARTRRVSFDLAGAAAFMVASGALVFGLDRAGHWAWRHIAVVTSFAIAALAVAVFVQLEKRSRDPILPPELLRHRSYLASCSCELLIQIATNGGLFVLPLLYTDHFDASVSRIAWYMSPLPIGMSLIAPLGGRIAARIGERACAVGGSLFLGVTCVIMVLGDNGGWLWVVLAGWFLGGIANGVIRPAIASAAAAALEPADYGAGMAATRMLSTMGAAAGITLAISLFPLGGYHLALYMCGVSSAIAAVGAIGLHIEQARSESVEAAAALTSLE